MAIMSLIIEFTDSLNFFSCCCVLMLLTRGGAWHSVQCLKSILVRDDMMKYTVVCMMKETT